MWKVITHKDSNGGRNSAMEMFENSSKKAGR